MRAWRNKERIWRFVCYAVILAGVLNAFQLVQKIGEAQDRRSRYLSVSDEIYYALGDLYWAKPRIDNFFFDPNRSYKISSGEDGSRAVYTNSRDLYALYVQTDFVYQYLSLDMVLKDPRHTDLYLAAAQPMAQLKDAIAANPSEEAFRSHREDFVEILERIEPLRGIWEGEAAGMDSGSPAFARKVFERFVTFSLTT